MADPFIGQIMPSPYTFAPLKWAFCNGALCNLQQNSALYAILGITYGGNGMTTFALPDMQFRIPIGSGAGAGLTTFPLGFRGGEESVALNESEVIAHTHQAMGGTDANVRSPANAVWGGNADQVIPWYTNEIPSYQDFLDFVALGVAGGSPNEKDGGNSLPHENMPPFLVVNYIIALEGIWPARP